MGLLGGQTTKALGGILGLGANKGNATPKRYPDDFKEGLILTEVVNGSDRDADKVQLVGRFMPHIPLEYGGSQRLAKEYYPGNSEPTVHILGSQESDTVFKGRFKTGKFKSENESLRDAAVEYQELIDGMRLRGNLVRAELGLWMRFGFIEDVKFRMNRLQDIEYEIKFYVVGFNPPTLDKNTRADGNVIIPNKQLITLAAEALASSSDIPESMPTDLADKINGFVNDVAEKVNLVTNFVSAVTSDIEAVTKAANRALGLVKNARAFISSTKRNVAAIGTSLETLGGSFSTEAQKTANTLKNVNHLHTVQRNFSSLAAQLAAIQASFAIYARSVPQFRHLVRNGDTLQKLAMKYYKNAESWKRIYDHNKLTTTDLVIGSVLEIPKE